MIFSFQLTSFFNSQIQLEKRKSEVQFNRAMHFNRLGNFQSQWGKARFLITAIGNKQVNL